MHLAGNYLLNFTRTFTRIEAYAANANGVIYYTKTMVQWYDENGLIIKTS